MRRSVFLGLMMLVGCAAIAAAPAQWSMPVTTHPVLQKAMVFEEVPVKLHGVVVNRLGKTVQFLLRPNEYQTCACNVRGDMIACACYKPEIGLCAEPSL